MRRFAFNLAAAVFAFAVGSLAACTGSLVSRDTVYALAQQLPLLTLLSAAAIWFFALAAGGVREKARIAFTLSMLFLGLVFLVFMVGTIAGATITEFDFG